MTSRQLNSLVREWQGRLGLQHWKIETLWITDPEEAQEKDAYIIYDPRYGDAKVFINPSAQIEQSVIHELLHLVIHGHKTPVREDIILERAINKLAEALYEARYAQAA